MANANAVLTLNGKTYNVLLTADDIIDVATGKSVAMPTNYDIDQNNGNILQNGHVIGSISALAAPSTTTSTASDSHSTTSGGTGSQHQNLSSDPVSTPTATGTETTPATTTTLPTSGTGTMFAGTRNLKDGGARIEVPGSDSPTNPNVEDAIKPDDFGPGSGGPGSGPGHDNDYGPDATNRTPDNTGLWGEGNPQHAAAPDGTYGSAALDFFDKINGVGSQVAPMISSFTSFAKMAGWLKEGGKLAGVSGLFSALGGGAAAFGVWSSIFNLKRGIGNKISNFFTLGLSAASTLYMLGGPIGGAVLAASIVIGLLTPKKDNAVNGVRGDVTNLSNTIAPAPPNWAQAALPNQSIYMILAGVTSLALSFSPGLSPIDLSSNAPVIRQEIIPPSLVPTFNQQFLSTMQTATNTTITGGSLLGKVFVKKDAANGNDKVVYVTEFTKEDGTQTQAVNVVSLNRSGRAVVGEFAPNSQAMLQPFFAATQDGKIKPNPAAFNDLGQMNAMAKAANSGVSPEGAARANFLAALAGHTAQPTGTAPPNTNNQ